MIIKEKIKSESGASLSAGLLFFIFCAVICSVILSAATTAVGRIRKIKETGQDEITIDSIKNILTDKLDTIETITIKHDLDDEFIPEYKTTIEDDIKEQIKELYFSIFPEELPVNWDEIIEEKNQITLTVDDRNGVWKKTTYKVDDEIDLTMYIFNDFHIEMLIEYKDQTRDLFKFASIDTTKIKKSDGTYRIQSKITYAPVVEDSYA